MNKKVKIKLILTIIVSLLCLPASAMELVFSLTPELAFPFLTPGKDKYEDVGYGAMLDTGIAVFDFLNVGTTAGFYAVPKKSSSKLKESQAKNVFFVPFGIKAGAVFYPLSRLSLSAGLSTGFSLAISGDALHEQPWYRAELGAAFRINPSISLGLSVGWVDYQFNSLFGNPLMEGLTAGISFTYRYDTKKSSGSVSATAEYDDNIFPLLYTVYKENSFGTVYVV